MRDVRIGTIASDGTSLQCDASDANAALGAMLRSSDGICWQHAHANEYNVYESTWWTLAHPGNTNFAANQNPIERIARDYNSHLLYFPNSHPMTRWEQNRRYFTLLGKFHDWIDVSELDVGVLSEDLAEAFGSYGHLTPNGQNDVSCGSPGEAANDPTLGHHYAAYLTQQDRGEEELSPYAIHSRNLGKTMPLATLAVNSDGIAKDEMRQRVAWALFQIYPIRCVCA